MTVTELAREAGVTERTFFRHFPTKEAVLFQDYETQLEWLAEALAQRPASESLFDAVLASVAAFPHDLEVVRQAATARAELISADRIASHLRVVQSSFAAVLAEFVRNRKPDVADVDLAAEVAGSAIAAALVVAVENWGRNGCVGDVGEIVAASLDLVRSGLAGGKPKQPVAQRVVAVPGIEFDQRNLGDSRNQERGDRFGRCPPEYK